MQERRERRRREDADLDTEVREFLDGLAGIIAEDVLRQRKARDAETDDGDAAGENVKNC